MSEAPTIAPPPAEESAVVRSRSSFPLTGTAATPSRVVLEGKYRLVDELGRGSMGTVFLAEDVSLKRKVAVKFLLPELANSTECAVRFKKEAVAMAAIQNENVARIFSYGEDKGTPYFVMEYLDGQTLEEIIDAHNRRRMFVPLAMAVDIMVQVLSGVAAIHRAGAVHRDIKPGNIMITEDPQRAVVMDFGLVRDIQVEDDMHTLAGTPAYIAPELVEGRPGATSSVLADIYSLGATFYELLTGSIPFGGENWVEILQKHVAEIPEFPSVRRRGLPDDFDDIVLRAMAKDPAERYQSCAEFLDDLIERVDVDAIMAASSMANGSPGPARRLGSGGFRRSPSHRSSDSNRRFRTTPSYSRGRLLVADADRDFRSSVYEHVKVAVPNCRVHSATDGSMALDMVKTVKPHVLIINLNLPELSGFEVVASLAADDGLRSMVVVAVAENAGAKDAQLLKAMGVRHLLSKPLDMEVLLEFICPALENPVAVASS